MKKIFLTVLLTIAITACNSSPQYTQAELQTLQPCAQMGYPLAQCMAAYQHAGRPNDYGWMNEVAAFAAGAVANHWWNRYNQPTYNYQPRYWDTHPRVNNTTVINNYSTQTYDTRPVQRQQQPTTIQPQPEKNISQLIPGQQVQPVFTPTKIVPNQSVNANSSAQPQAPVAQQPAKDFKPIMVQPPVQNTPSIQQPTTKFNPIAVQAPARIAAPVVNKPAANSPSFSPIRVQAASKPAFKPVQVSKSKK